MKIRTPCPSRTPSSNEISCSFCSRSSKSDRTLSRSSAAPASSSRFARPRTISARSCASPPLQAARPSSTSLAAVASSSRRARAISVERSTLASARVRPRKRVLRKFDASVRADGVTPAGRRISRFSTVPSSKTMIASVRSAPRDTNSTCLTPASRIGVTTTPAPPARPDRMALASFRASSKLRPWACSRASIALRSAAPTSPTSSRPSTKSLRPAWVGNRPALTWVAPSRPSWVRSCMVLRIEAGDSDTPPFDRVRDPTGSPVSR